MYIKNLNKRCLLHQKSELSHPQPKYCLTPRLYQANVINTSQNKPRKVGGRKGRCVGYYGSPRGPYLLRIKWKNQDIQYYSVKGLGGETFQFPYICPGPALRSTIDVLTIRPIKENFQWHFGVAACCLSKPGWGGDTCTFFARSSHSFTLNWQIVMLVANIFSHHEQF